MNYSKIFRYNVLLLIVLVLVSIFISSNYKVGELPYFLTIMTGVLFTLIPLLFTTSFLFAIISLFKKSGETKTQETIKDTDGVNVKRVVKTVLLILSIGTAILPFVPPATYFSSLWLAGVIFQLFFTVLCFSISVILLLIAAFIKEN